MNAYRLGFLAASIAGVVALSPHAFGALPGRLFPDVSLRFPTGDPTAANPINATEGPKALAAGDMNGDGRADVIAGNLDGSISVLLGLTNNTLATQILTPATGVLSNSSLRAVVVADFNGDTRLDVVAGDIAGEGLVVLLGNGDGSLAPSRRIDLGPVRAIAVADFDRDGRQDLLVACSPPNCDWCLGTVTNAARNFLCILRGNGDGSFAPPQYLLSPGTQACFYDVEAADMDNDGHMDALALDFTSCYFTNGIVQRIRRIQLFANNGTGGFTADAPTRTLEPAGEGPRSFRVGYIDEQRIDGSYPANATLDIVVANRDSSTIDILLNHGGMNFSEPMSLHAVDRPRDVAIGDLDGDGRSDLVVVERDENLLTVFRGMGGGSFDRQEVSYATGVSPRQVVLADINGDGVLDAAANNRVSEDISLFIGEPGVAGFLLPGGFYPAGVSPVSVVAVDFNHDGAPDLATANLRSHDVRILLNTSTGAFSNETIYPVNYQPAFLASGDLNQDGHVDLVVTCLGGDPNTPQSAGSLVTLLGRGDGTFHPAVSSQLAGSGSRPFWLRLGDLDNDEVLDAVVGGMRGELVAFRGTGTGTFEAGVEIGPPGAGRPLGLALGDFDGNGKLDIATSRGQILLNDGQFFAGDNFTNGVWNGRVKRFPAGVQAWAVEAEDLDGDGILDLMLALTFVQPDPIGVYFGVGDGTFHEPTIYSGPDVGVVALEGRDMDGDGIKDIVVGNRCAATVIIMRGLGDRRFEYREIINAYSVEDVAVADLNGDGKPDIVGVGLGVWVALNGGTNELVAPRESFISNLPERTGLFINEIMALNVEFHVTNSSTPDWIEIYNHSALAQNMAGWSLVQYPGDNDTNRWTFPEMNAPVIQPWQHLIIYCRKKPGTNVGLYATFELSSDGENISLLRPGGMVEDSVVFPPMPADVSYARSSDGARFFNYTPAPTLGSANRRPGNLDPSAQRKDPYVGPGGSSLGLNARFFDDVAIAYAAVCYRVAGSSAWEEVALSDDGLHGDKLAGDGYYGAILPPLPPGATIEYYLRVVDNEGQTGSSPGDIDNSAKLHRVIVPEALPTLRLTELVAANNTGLRDERGQYEDWVELMNTGPMPQSLAGLALSRDYFDRTSAWNFPSLTIQPGERIIIFCDDDPQQGPLHATFKLLRNGDRIFLIRTDTWSILDSLSFNALPWDTSFGVLGNGTEAQWLAWPTPGAENIPLPPRRAPAVAGAELFWRMPTNAVGGRSFVMRWIAPTNRTSSVEWSDDLRTWEPAAFPPIVLGEGMHQWSEGASAPRRFYRIVSR